MKKQLLILITIFFSTITFSQKFEILKSDIFKDKKKHSTLSYTLEDGQGGLITIRKFYGGGRVKGYYMQHFDKNLKLKKEFTYEVKKNRIESAFVKNGNLHLIEFDKNFDKKSITYKLQTSAINDFNFSSKELLKISKENVLV